MEAFISNTDAICKNLLSKIGNGEPDSLRLAANYLCLGGESSNIPKAICDSLNSLFDKYKTSEFSQTGFEMFFDGLCKNLIKIFVYSDVETASITTLGEQFKVVDSMLGGSPEFLFPTPTHDSEAKYYAHLFVKILNEKNATVFPECYSENGIAKHCKDYLIPVKMTKAKLCGFTI
ncbi:hypothetical protein MHBO_004856 [Bonamia ostreae]|uniref:Uncharacterized protein n=1 Tax=Bonamia ostreae TaxID=126728 RepID=A0ABV2AUK0_9EUKA